MYKAGNITHAQKKVSSQLGHFPNAFCALIQTLKGETNVRKQGARVEVSAAPNVRRQRCCHFALVRVVVLSSSTVHLGFSEVGKSLQSQDSLINQRPSSEKFFKQRNLYLYVHRLLPNQRLTVLLYLIACFPTPSCLPPPPPPRRGDKTHHGELSPSPEETLLSWKCLFKKVGDLVPSLPPSLLCWLSDPHFAPTPKTASFLLPSPTFEPVTWRQFFFPFPKKE